MSDQANAARRRATGDPDEIPVEELIRLTRQFTRRITNQDRQRLALDLRESGHQRSLQLTAPLALQQFFAGEIDLDAELARRSVNAPLLSHVAFEPKPGRPIHRQATAIFSCQDDSMNMTVEAQVPNGHEASLEFTFTLFSALAMRFKLPSLISTDRARWIELMRRESGIAFLWTRDRWEKPYLIFVVREYFARVYAFSPQGFEAAARMTPDMVTEMLNWLQSLWFPNGSPAEAETTPRPSLLTRPATRLTPPPAPSPTTTESAAESSSVQERDLPAEDLEW